MTFKKKTENENKKNEQEKNDDDEMEWTEESKGKNSLLEYWRRITSDEQKKKIKEDREKEWKKNYAHASTRAVERKKRLSQINSHSFIIFAHMSKHKLSARPCVCMPPFAHFT